MKMGETIRTPKRHLVLLGCVGLTGLFVVGMMRTLRPPPSPLEHAIAVARTTGWLSEGGDPRGFPAYYWSTGNHLTYFHTGADGAMHLFRRQATAAINAPGVEGPVVPLGNGRYAGLVSPNGTWFAEWGRNKLRQSIPTFISADGIQRREGQPTWGIEGVWTPDSASMLSGVWRTGAAIVFCGSWTATQRRSSVCGNEREWKAPGLLSENGRDWPRWPRAAWAGTSARNERPFLYSISR